MSSVSSESDIDASDSSSHVVKISHHGSRKRRKVSPSFEDQTHPQSSLPTPALSRIKAKKTGPLLKDSGEPDTVEAVVRGKSNSSFATLGVHPWLVASLAALSILDDASRQQLARCAGLIVGGHWAVRDLQ